MILIRFLVIIMCHNKSNLNKRKINLSSLNLNAISVLINKVIIKMRLKNEHRFNDII